MQGLRTLVLGTKILTEEVWADWDSRYQDAAAQLDNRDEALAALAVEIEADLEMVGVTAIEDKLQEGVPAAIQSLLNAGMKVMHSPIFTYAYMGVLVTSPRDATGFPGFGYLLTSYNAHLYSQVSCDCMVSQSQQEMSNNRSSHFEANSNTWDSFTTCDL